MQNWRTTAAGVVLAAASFVSFSPDLFVGHAWITALAKFAMIGGFGALGIAAKDAKP
jgi:hypothetical protein